MAVFGLATVRGRPLPVRRRPAPRACMPVAGSGRHAAATGACARV